MVENTGIYRQMSSFVNQAIMGDSQISDVSSVIGSLRENNIVSVVY